MSSTMQADDLCDKLTIAGVPITALFVVTDPQYAVLSDKGLDTVLDDLRDWFTALDLNEWRENEHDCDNFCVLARGFAGILHAKQKDKPKHCGLAFGELHYSIDGNRSKGHAINVAVTRDNGDASVQFIEPQTFQRVNLSGAEKQSILRVIF